MTPCRLDAFAGGALVALILDRAGLAAMAGLLSRRAALTTTVALLVLAALFPLSKHELLFHTFKYAAFAAIFGGLVFLAVTPSSFGRILAAIPLWWLGRYAYGLYVFHMLLLPLFKQFFGFEMLARTLHIPRLLAAALFGVLASAVALAAALVSYHLFEKPVLALARASKKDAPAAHPTRSLVK
jgi:peptidoglycan/LPS O-acetylase OafA/YrhL